jgi:hypothetical protein
MAAMKIKSNIIAFQIFFIGIVLVMAAVVYLYLLTTRSTARA